MLDACTTTREVYCQSSPSALLTARPYPHPNPRRLPDPFYSLAGGVAVCVGAFRFLSFQPYVRGISAIGYVIVALICASPRCFEHAGHEYTISVTCPRGHPQAVGVLGQNASRYSLSAYEIMRDRDHTTLVHFHCYDALAPGRINQLAVTLSGVLLTGFHLMIWLLERFQLCSLSKDLRQFLKVSRIQLGAVYS
jgi:hypothetical protein